MLVENINANPASLFIHQKTTIREYYMKGNFRIEGNMLKTIAAWTSFHFSF
jgi:hypothetical protein